MNTSIFYHFQSFIRNHPSSTVMGLVGESALLPCNVDVALCGEVYFITWTKNTSIEWKRIYLYSDDVKKPLQELANPDRADFRVEESAAYLRISPLEMEDEGSYKCDVTYVQGKCPSLSYAHLIIMMKPSPPIIIKDGQALKHASTIGPFIEGTTLSLECKTSGGKPAPEVTWWKGSESLPSRRSIADDEIGASNVTSSIRFILSRSDLGARLECHVKHDTIEKEIMVTWVEIDVNVKPFSLEIEGPSAPVVAGATVKLLCTIEGAKPAAKVTWYNQSKIVEFQPESYSEFTSDGTFKTVSVLEIIVSHFDHQGTFNCKGTNPVLEKKGEVPLLKSIDLQILYLPIVMVQPIGRLTINETSEARLFCSFKANPSNLSEVTWYKDGVEVVADREQTFEFSASGVPTLSIRNVSRNARGTYSCSLRNIIGLGNARNVVEMNILYVPAVKTTMFPGSINEGHQGSVSLTCETLDGNPESLLRVRWYKNNELLKETEEKEIVWQNVDRNFMANYSCEGENVAGWSGRSEPRELVVNYLPGPATVIEESPSVLKGHPSTLECKVEDLGRPSATEYRWEHFGKVLLATNHKLTVEVMDLKDRGNYSCSAVNAAGPGPRGEFYLSMEAPPAVMEELPEMYGAPSDAKNVSLSCRIECDPLCEIQWRKNEENITDSYLYLIKSAVLPEDTQAGYFISVVSTLQWNLTAWPGGTLDRDLDNANYTCVGSGTAAGPSVSTSTEFRVEYPPENIKLSIEGQNVVEGNVPERVLCSANSWPPSEYTWKYSNLIIGSSSQLFLNYSISRQRAGTYECLASNPHGEAVGRTYINVLYKPDCIIYQDKTKDGDTSLVCEARANPTEVNFTWIRNNETLKDYIVVEGTRSILELRTSFAEHNGKYLCVVNNSVGESVPCILELKSFMAGWIADFWDDNILITAAVVAAVVIVFGIIVIIIILTMRRRRTPSSGSSKKSKSDGDTFYPNSEKKGSGKGSPLAEAESKPMYENMKLYLKGPKGNPSLPTNNEGLVFADLSLPSRRTNTVFRKNVPTDNSTLTFVKEGDDIEEPFQARHK
ncbi:B-cell receptor CD22-like isoform X2 [Tachypleus tridentatus]|uniref:B-cell receptor CD22-like isoform X2 n=2 Tax=Tachypleus tridentatus TaxID=6853 RepID=UPI003FD1E1AF